MSIKFAPLSEVSKEDLLNLMNHPKMRRHMPLLKGTFDEAKYDAFITAKQKIWEEYGYGPWAFTLDGECIGWGGLQPMEQDVEIAIVLHPNHWGEGKAIYERIVQYAFQDKELDSVIILFPPSRTRIKGILKMGFQPDGESTVAGHPFLRYRLRKKEEHLEARES